MFRPASTRRTGTRAICELANGGWGSANGGRSRRRPPYVLTFAPVRRVP
jgi:hypothetical protein